NTSLADNRFVHLAIAELRARQNTWSSINRSVWIIKIELRYHRCHIDIDVIESLDRSNVFPITIEQILLHVTARKRCRNNLFSKIDVLLILEEQVAQHLFFEDVYPH